MMSALRTALVKGVNLLGHPSIQVGSLRPLSSSAPRLVSGQATAGCLGDKCHSCACVSSTVKRFITSNQTDKNLADPQAKALEATQYGSGNQALTSNSQATLNVAEENIVHHILTAEIVSTKLKLTLSNGEALLYPTVWLRDNCQCRDCFNSLALGRSFLMQNLTSAPGAAAARVTAAGDVEVQWQDGHTSAYRGQWLQERSFTEGARRRYRNKFALPKKQWSSSHMIEEFSYPLVMQDDLALLKWLYALETWGAVLLKETPAEPAAAYELCERVATVKYTHFGLYSSVVNHPAANNLAYTNQALNLHNDMPQYNEIPGLIFLHMIKQHRGEGGETIISDGFRAAERMREQHPELFKILTSTDVYFWDKGQGKDQMEMQEFYKINKGPTIQLNNRGEVTTIRFNNQVRDSYLDLPEDKVEEFYEALQVYFRNMYDNSIRYKMQDGDMTVLDNVRCQHGRTAFNGDMNARHLVTTFMSWDEAACRRRRLQEKFPSH